MTANVNDFFGAALSMDASGITCAIGAPGYSSDAGCVFIFKNYGIGGAWTLFLTINNNVAGEAFGSSVALNAAGTRLVVGAPNNSVYGANRGVNYIYNYNASTLQWVLDPTYQYANTSSANRKGTCLAMNSYGNRFVSGAPSSSAASWTPYNVYVYDRQMECNDLVWSGTNWVAGGKGANPLAYSPDGLTWTNNSLVSTVISSPVSTAPLVQLAKQYTGTGASNYFAFATALNAAGTRLAVLSSGTVSSAVNNNVTCNIYDYNGNAWLTTPSATYSGLGYTQYINQMDYWISSAPGANNNVNAGFTPVALNAAGDRLAIGCNFGTSGARNTGFVNVYHYNYTTQAWPTLVSSYSVKYTGTINGSYNFFGSCVAFNAMGTRLFISSVNDLYNSGSASATQTGYVNIYDNVNGNWNASQTRTYTDNNIQPTTNTANPNTTITYFGASIATNSAGDKLVVGAPCDYNQANYYGTVYIFEYNYTTNSWPNSVISNGNAQGSAIRYYTCDQYGGDLISYYVGCTFGNSVSMNSAGDRIAVGEQNQYNTSNIGRAYIFEYNYTTNSWPGANTSGNNIGIKCASRYYIGNGDRQTYQFVGNNVALNAAGDRLIVGAPRYNPFTQVQTGTVYIIDYNYTTQSWPVGNVYYAGDMVISSAGIPYILGASSTDYLGSTLAINAAGTVLAIGTNQANTQRGYLNVYNYGNNNYVNKLALTQVNALASNGTTTVAGGVGTPNVMAYSTDGGITFSNSVGDSTIFLNNYKNYSLSKAIDNTTNSAYFGEAISLNAAGTVLAVGAPSATNSRAFIYNYDGTSWSPARTFVNPGSSGDAFGFAVSLNAAGTVLAVGARDYNPGSFASNGRAYIYNYNGTSWPTSPSQTIDPTSNNTGQIFGDFLILNSAGTILAVGARNYNSGKGRVYIYNYNGTQWVTAQTLESPDNSAEQFGNEIAINTASTVMAVGAYGYSYDKGRVYIYNYTSGAWPTSPSQTITSPTGYTASFGTSIAFNTETTIMAVGAYSYSSQYGRVYIYNYASGAWPTSQSQTFESPDGIADFGYSIAMNSAGTILAVGANIAGVSNAGRAYIYNYTGSAWNTTPTQTISPITSGEY